MRGGRWGGAHACAACKGRLLPAEYKTGGWAQRARAKCTSNISSMLVTLDVCQLEMSALKFSSL